MLRASSIRTRTESHIPHLSLPFSHNRSLLFSAIPSDLFLPFFHPPGIHFCFYSHLSVTAAWWASHRFFSSVQRESICSFLVPPHLFSLPYSSISPSASPVDSCLSRGNLFHPSIEALSCAVPTYCSSLSVCAVSVSEWTGGGARRQEWANRQLRSQMLLSVPRVSFLFPISPFLSASLHHDLLSLCRHASPPILVSKGRQRGGVWDGE